MSMKLEWNVHSSDAAMNGPEFARRTTADGFGRVLVHAAPAKARIEGAVRRVLSNHTGRPDDWALPHTGPQPGNGDQAITMER